MGGANARGQLRLSGPNYMAKRERSVESKWAELTREVS